MLLKKFTSLVGVAALLLAVSSGTQAQAPTVMWGPLTFFLGDWVGEGSAENGSGSGATSFTFDLQKRVIIRRNRAKYAATKEHPAYVHDDLMIIYRESATGPFRATFYDNEGHVINYLVQISADERTFTLLSDLVPDAPRFRLTYQKTSPTTMDLKFEIAPPGKPEAFAQFIEGKLKRK